MQQLELLTADDARRRYSNELFVNSIKLINVAILEASVSTHKVTVNIPTGVRKGDLCNAVLVAHRLSEVGFDVLMYHDQENESTELTIDWTTKV